MGWEGGGGECGELNEIAHCILFVQYNPTVFFKFCRFHAGSAR